MCAKQQSDSPRRYSNPVSTVSRQLGVAVAELYQDAIAGHQGTFYQVTTIGASRTLFVPPETYELLREKIRLFDPSFLSMLPDYPDQDDYDGDLNEWMQAVNDKIRIEEPDTVIAHITDPLSMFRCDRCGTMIPLSSGRIDPKRICPTCHSNIFQAPIYVFKGEVSAEKIPPKTLEKITSRPCDRCKKRGKTVWLHMKPTDKRAPFGTLRLYCPECDKRPDTRDAKLVSRKGRRVTLPTQSLMRPVSATVCQLGREASPMPMHGLVSSEYVKAITYHKQIQVHRIVFGYSFSDSGITKPLPKFSGRKFKTQGIAVHLRRDCFHKLSEHLDPAHKGVYRDPDLFKEFMNDLQKPGKSYFHADEQQKHEEYDEDQFRRWVLHSLAHTLMIMLPLKTGLEATKFGYSYDVKEGRVIIYDNEEGGIGGCQSLAEDEFTWSDYLDITRRHLEHCDCRARCYRCIVLSMCGEVNNALNRHLLGPLFDILTDYE